MIKFGPSGNSLSFYEMGYKKTEQAPEFLQKLELDCFEYSFGRGIKMSDEKCLLLNNAFKSANKEISVHAPYFINFANEEEEKIEKSFSYVLDSAKKLQLLGGNRLVFHPATMLKLTREQAVKNTTENLLKLRDKIYESGLENLVYCPETMGKLGQIGTIEEVVSFCKLDKIFTPCVDFGHVNARENGSLKVTTDYLDRLNFMIDQLSFERMQNFHIHFSKIEYSKKGEVRHLTFEDKVYGPEFYPLAVALDKLNLSPYIICESSGTQAEDAKEMKEIFNKVTHTI